MVEGGNYAWGRRTDSQNQLWLREETMLGGGEPIAKISYGHLWLREETMLGGGEPIVKISYGHLWLREENLCLNKNELRDLET
jgi:hypothetical protein